MHVILVSVGTDGDVFPYAGLGAKLLARGHQVTFVASAHYEALARPNGLAFRPLVSAAEHQALFEHPDFWRPLKTAPLAARWGMRLLKGQYELLSKLIPPDALLVASPGVFAATLVHEKAGVPLAHLVLQPWMIPSSIAPPLMPGLTFLRRAPRPVWRVFWSALDVVGALLVGGELNRFRASLGLPPIRHLFHNWLSPQLVLGLFPEWYGPPQPDWPPQVRLTGFPMFDGAASRDLPPPVLAFCRAGAPLAFTFGTGMAHSAELFRAALEACRLLGQRGLFLTRYSDQLPHPPPPSVRHCAFAPFHTLFPLCAAVVHHGGIGTVAQALAAGTPQLIRPICFDQADNGLRVKRLGAGDYLQPSRASGRQIAQALTRLLTPETRSRCRAVSARFQHRDALQTAAQCLEEFMAVETQSIGASGKPFAPSPRASRRSP
jgi:UDP:flavonoid glycosyltransferase YjiC (YdhE family)